MRFAVEVVSLAAVSDGPRSPNSHLTLRFPIVFFDTLEFHRDSRSLEVEFSLELD
jgi:hypothetical protein